MRIAVLSYECADYSIQLANGLAGECEVLLMLARQEVSGQQDSIHSAVKFVPFDKPRLRQVVRQWRTSFSLVRTIRRFQPDVLHVQHGHLWFNQVLPLLRSIPLVVTVHDPQYHIGDRSSQRTPRWITEMGIRRADRLIVHGDVLKRQLAETLGMADSTIHVVPHVAIGAADPPRIQEEDGRTVLFFGRIWDYKGLKYLIEAEPFIRSVVPNVRIVIAGEGEEFERYRQLMERPESFEVHNRYIPISERDELFRRASIVALPYIEATQSGVIPVAYSFAKPVVATRVGALAEAVDHENTGLLVPAANPRALGESIATLLIDQDRRRAMGAAGRMKLDCEWSPTVVAERTLDVYRRAVSDRQSVNKSSALATPRTAHAKKTAAR